MIKLINVSVIYGIGTQLEHLVLDNINLEIPEGQFLGIIGSNGAGKSTLTKVIAGDVSINKGKIMIDESDCTKMNVVQRSPLISHVFQDTMKGVAPELSVLENLIFASHRGRKREFKFAINNNVREFFREKVKILNMKIEDKLDYKIKLLSGGQRQALNIIMATLCPAKLLILDEHTASLNPSTANLIMEITRDIVRKNKLTTMMVTHNMEEASYCDRILSISDGKLEYRS